MGVAQIKAKYNNLLVELFRETFCFLPLAHCLNSKVLVLHGGLFSQDGVTLDDIRKVDRNMCVSSQVVLRSSPQVRGLIGLMSSFDVEESFLQPRMTVKRARVHAHIAYRAWYLLLEYKEQFEMLCGCEATHQEACACSV